MATKETTAKTGKAPKEPKVKRINRSVAANTIIAAIEGKTTLTDLAAKADALFVEHGGKSDLKAASDFCRRALETADAIGALKLTRPTDLIVERIKK